jgi:hypothetical protein
VFFAQERLLSRVQSRVRFEIWFFRKTFFAYLALVRLGIQMRVNMNFQSFNSLKSLGAKITLVRLLAGVDHVVCFQLTSGAEGLKAGVFLTLERFFSSVIEDMYFKTLHFCVLFQTFGIRAYEQFVGSRLASNNFEI